MATALLAATALVALWFALPLVIAPLVLAVALVTSSGATRRPRPRPRADVHHLPAVHPSDDALRVVC